MPIAAPSPWNRGPRVTLLQVEVIFEALGESQGLFLTATQITAELEQITLAILRITESKVSTFSTGGRQVAFEGAGKLEALYKRQQYLEAQLTRINAGGGGIRVRPGVIRD